MQTLNYFLFFIQFICFLFVIAKMYQEAGNVLAISCVVGLLVCGIGGLVAFVIGWVKAREWEITPFMIAWSVCVGINILLSIMGMG